MNNQNIVLLIFAILFLILFYMCYNNKKESFEGIAGTSFVSRVPKGTIVAYYPPDGNTTNIPAGWVVCDGKTTLQGNTNVPDLRGKFIVGVNSGDKNNDFETYDLKRTGGEEKHLLTLQEIPPLPSSDNKKTFIVQYDPDPAFSNSKFGGEGANFTHRRNFGTNQASPIVPNSIGGGPNTAHENRPPFYALIYIIKL
jgi:microcystin-dependent protein